MGTTCHGTWASRTISEPWPLPLPNRDNQGTSQGCWEPRNDRRWVSHSEPFSCPGVGRALETLCQLPVKCCWSSRGWREKSQPLWALTVLSWEEAILWCPFCSRGSWEVKSPAELTEPACTCQTKSLPSPCHQPGTASSWLDMMQQEARLPLQVCVS